MSSAFLRLRYQAGDTGVTHSTQRVASNWSETVQWSKLVLFYLVIQYWVDRKDPKLAVAPVHAKHDLARFV